MDFKIEMETLENAITTYDNAISLLESNLDTLNSSLSALKVMHGLENQKNSLCL